MLSSLNLISIRPVVYKWERTWRLTNRRDPVKPTGNRLLLMCCFYWYWLMGLDSIRIVFCITLLMGRQYKIRTDYNIYSNGKIMNYERMWWLGESHKGVNYFRWIRYIRQRTGSSLAQVMAYRLLGVKRLPELMLAYCQLDSWEYIQCSLNHISLIFIQENAIENVCPNGGNFSRGRWVKALFD